MKDYNEIFELWVKKAKDKFVCESLKAMENDDEEKKDAFFEDLEFGTAGLRGIMRAGTNGMNYYTVAKATCGLANYMIANGMSSAAVAYDSRNNSEFFARTAACVLANHGIKAYVTDGCMPTPFLSFSVRYLKCDMGINITASHNPAEYNGYKVYNSEGCQLTDSACAEVTKFIEKIDEFNVEAGNFQEFLHCGKIEFVPQAASESFLQNVYAQSLGSAAGVKVAYSALNGTGFRFVPQILQMVAADKVALLAEQCYPDGNFPTCPKPNPELDETLARVIAFAEENGCDIAVATDPDCDRIGIAVKHKGKFVRLTGNETGIILTDYILNSLKEQNALPQNGVLVKTIVTTTLAEKIAADFGVETANLLTGFKYIGEYIGKLEKQNAANRCVFGFEESCGYLRGTYVRDKDAVVASMLVAEAVAYHKNHGATLVDRLNALYDIYGHYEHHTFRYAFGGVEGAEKKQSLLASLHKNGIKYLGNSKVVMTKDFLKNNGDGLPKSDVLKFTAEDGSELVVRPSGTEPLIKTYITVCCNPEQNEQKISQIHAQLDELLK